MWGLAEGLDRAAKHRELVACAAAACASPEDASSENESESAEAASRAERGDAWLQARGGD